MNKILFFGRGIERLEKVKYQIIRPKKARDYEYKISRDAPMLHTEFEVFRSNSMAVRDDKA